MTAGGAARCASTVARLVLKKIFREIFIEFPLFNKTEAECETPLDYWLYNLKHMEQLEHLSFKGQKALFVRLEELARIANMNKKERGKEEGRKEGIELGRKEEKIQIALQMKRDNLPVSMIVKYSGLTEEEIDNL